MTVNQQPHTSHLTSQLFMATDTHNYQKLISITLYLCIIVLRHQDLFRFSYVLYLPPCQEEINQLCCHSNTSNIPAILQACSVAIVLSKQE